MKIDDAATACATFVPASQLDAMKTINFVTCCLFVVLALLVAPAQEKVMSAVAVAASA